MNEEGSVTIRVRKLRPGAHLPVRGSEQATGYDLHASLPDGPVALGPVPVSVPTGLAFEAPPQADVQVRPRSGLARQGVLVAFGTVDPDYRGELRVTMYTTSPGVEHVVHDGDRIAQVVVTVACEADFEEAGSLGETARGDGGFGSTGR